MITKDYKPAYGTLKPGDIRVVRGDLFEGNANPPCVPWPIYEHHQLSKGELVMIVDLVEVKDAFERRTYAKFLSSKGLLFCYTGFVYAETSDINILV